jgi:hypothetical protein
MRVWTFGYKKKELIVYKVHGRTEKRNVWEIHFTVIFLALLFLTFDLIFLFST